MKKTLENVELYILINVIRLRFFFVFLYIFAQEASKRKVTIEITIGKNIVNIEYLDSISLVTSIWRYHVITEINSTLSLLEILEFHRKRH